MIIRILIYLVFSLLPLLAYWKKPRPYILSFLPLIWLSFFGSLDTYQNLAPPMKLGVFLLSLVPIFFILRGLYRESKEIKLDILREKRQDQRRTRDIQEKDPTRRQKVIILDRKSKEEKVYWASPSLGQRLEEKTRTQTQEAPSSQDPSQEGQKEKEED
ncbi:MAG: hypothetical protein Q4E37_04455 [Tissierellia bacterium]|nr:hypothetical protein [Tissierellia bacterium]